MPNLSYVIDQERKRIPPSPPKKSRRKDRNTRRIIDDDSNTITIFETQVFLNLFLFLC